MRGHRDDKLRALAVGTVVAALWASAAPAWAEEATSEEPLEELTLIRASSELPGVEVVIDGHHCGRTPALVEVTPGPHEVVLVTAAGRLASTIVAVEGETVEVRVDGGPAAPAPVAPPPGHSGGPDT